MFSYATLLAHSRQLAATFNLASRPFTARSTGEGIELRLQIICLLLRFGTLSVQDLTDRTGKSQSYVSRTLGKLREGGFVKGLREGKYHYYSISHGGRAKLADIFVFLASVDGLGYKKTAQLLDSLTLSR